MGFGLWGKLIVLFQTLLVFNQNILIQYALTWQIGVLCEFSFRVILFEMQ